MSLLNGIRVVEMGLWVAGPAAGGILADWGAEVVKIEMLNGDPMRKLFGALSGSKEERCPPFDLYNRGKKSIALDVNHPDGMALVQSLVATADVFITNMRPQFLQRAGLDHATLVARYPKLVYASLTAYGLEGPDRDAPGYDMAAFSGRSGMADRATPPGGAPPILPGGLGDNITAMATVAGIMGALFHRERSGDGQWRDDRVRGRARLAVQVPAERGQAADHRGEIARRAGDGARLGRAADGGRAVGVGWIGDTAEGGQGVGVGGVGVEGVGVEAVGVGGEVRVARRIRLVRHVRIVGVVGVGWIGVPGARVGHVGVVRVLVREIGRRVMDDEGAGRQQERHEQQGSHVDFPEDGCASTGTRVSTRIRSMCRQHGHADQVPAAIR